MLLITGCGRSGTHFMSALLREMGLDIPHEDVGRDGASSWKHIAYEVGSASCRFTRILHLVRHPLKVIGSMQTFSDSTWDFMAQHIPLDLNAHPLRRSMQAWIGWNRLIESKAAWRFRIEDLEENFAEFCKQADLPPQEMPKIDHSAKYSRTDHYEAVYWENIVAVEPNLAEGVRLMALRYGYEDIAKNRPPLDKTAMSSEILSKIVVFFDI